MWVMHIPFEVVIVAVDAVCARPAGGEDDGGGGEAAARRRQGE